VESSYQSSDEEVDAATVMDSDIKFMWSFLNAIGEKVGAWGNRIGEKGEVKEYKEIKQHIPRLADFFEGHAV
jgi:hypothetical protein